MALGSLTLLTFYWLTLCGTLCAFSFSSSFYLHTVHQSELNVLKEKMQRLRQENSHLAKAITNNKQRSLSCYMLSTLSPMCVWLYVHPWVLYTSPLSFIHSLTHTPLWYHLHIVLSLWLWQASTEDVAWPSWGGGLLGGKTSPEGHPWRMCIRWNASFRREKRSMFTAGDC